MSQLHVIRKQNPPNSASTHYWYFYNPWTQHGMPLSWSVFHSVPWCLWLQPCLKCPHLGAACPGPSSKPAPAHLLCLELLSLISSSFLTSSFTNPNYLIFSLSPCSWSDSFHQDASPRHQPSLSCSLLCSWVETGAGRHWVLYREDSNQR